MDEDNDKVVYIVQSDAGAELVPLSSIPSDPKKLLGHLLKVNGDIKKFAEAYPADQMTVLYEAEIALKSEPFLYAQWKDAIKLNQQVRLRLLQDDALTELESYTADKPGDSIAYAKLVLGDLIAGEIATAKKAEPFIVPPPPEEKDDSDEDEALEAMNL